MLDYQTAKDLFEEIQVAAAANNEESLMSDLLFQSLDYSQFLVNEEMEHMFHDEDDDFRMSITEETKRSHEKNLIATINAIGTFLKVKTIKSVLVEDSDKIDFAKYVVLLVIEDLRKRLE